MLPQDYVSNTQKTYKPVFYEGSEVESEIIVRSRISLQRCYWLILLVLTVSACKPSENALITINPDRIIVSGESPQVSELMVTHTGNLNPKLCSAEGASKVVSVETSVQAGEYQFALALISTGLNSPMMVSIGGCDSEGRPVPSIVASQN